MICLGRLGYLVRGAREQDVFDLCSLNLGSMLDLSGSLRVFGSSGKRAKGI